MTFVHLYRDRNGKIADEHGSGETYDEAMDWLDGYHDSFERGGLRYLCTLEVQTSPDFFGPKLNLLDELESWRAADRESALLDHRHNLSLLGAK